MKVDKELINLRLDIVDKNLNEIKKIVAEGKENYMKNYRTQLAAKHALLQIMEACIDIGNHIIASLGLRRPEEYKDVFEILEENGIIPKPLSKRLQNMARFRNLLVHQYTRIDERIVFKILKEDVKDIKEFIRCILKIITKNSKLKAK